MLRSLVGSEMCIRDRLTAGVKLAILPIAIWYYLTTDLLTAIILTSITSFFGGFYLSVSFALNQSLLPPARRALGSALLLFCINIIGLGFGPQLVGILSDYFSADYGVDGLRYALIAVVSINLWGCFHYFWAGRNLREDLKIAETRSALSA